MSLMEVGRPTVNMRNTIPRTRIPDRIKRRNGAENIFIIPFVTSDTI